MKLPEVYSTQGTALLFPIASKQKIEPPMTAGNPNVLDPEPPAVLEAFAGPGVWSGEDMARHPDWKLRLTDAQAEELRRAVRDTRERGLPIMSIGRENFPLAELGPALGVLRADVLEGRGFGLIRGVPVDDDDPELAARAFWGIGCWLGEAVSQNAQGHLLGHVTDLRHEAREDQRIYQTARALPYHSDSCDLVGLLCLRTTGSGGESRIASAAMVHNRLLERDPALLETLYGPFHCDRWGEIPKGKAATYRARVFSRYGAYLTCCGMHPDILSAQRLDAVPRLTARQSEALERMQETAEELSLMMDLQPGDLQVLHNHTILHARGAYRDHGNPARRRHLLRLWLSAHDGRPLPDFFAERWGKIEVGSVRGGIIAPNTRHSAPVRPGR